jgi:hypothetical protein
MLKFKLITGFVEGETSPAKAISSKDLGPSTVACSHHASHVPAPCRTLRHRGAPGNHHPPHVKVPLDPALGAVSGGGPLRRVLGSRNRWT